jgi:RHS repeat-associated protein
MGYHLTTSLDLPSARSHASPKTHVPWPRLQERGLRFYSPEVGRWLSRDPIEEDGGENLYLMSDNDSIDQIDAIGLVGAPNCCCCCADNLLIGDVSIATGTTGPIKPDLFGHKFEVEFSVKYIKDPKVRTDCTVQWWEKTNRPIPGTSTPPNRWTNMYPANEHNSNMFGDWMGRRKQCPGRDTGKFRDKPMSSTRAPKRTLFFAIRIKSGDGCPCGSSEITVYATQVLDTDGNGRITTWVFSRGIPQSQLPVPN